MGSRGRRDAAVAVRVGRRGGSEAEVGVFLRSQVHRRVRPNEGGQSVASVQQRQVRVQRAEEDLEQLREGLERLLQEGQLDAAAG